MLRLMLTLLSAVVMAIIAAPVLPDAGRLLQVTAVLPQRVIYRDITTGVVAQVQTLPSNITSIVVEPQGNRMAVHDTNGHIVIYNLPEGDRQVFSNPHASRVVMDWHGEYLVVIGNDGAFNMNVNTGEFTPLTDERVRYVDTSPEQVLAYTTRGGLFLQAADEPRGWMLRRMSVNSPIYSEPTFSPDGNRLAFVADSYEPAERGIFIYDMEDHSMRKITPDAFRVVNRPAWSADGDRIVYQYITGRTSHLYMIDLETGRQTTLGETVPATVLVWTR
ncbi:MAG: hypothetical protein AAFU54_21075 [Chloroflexota bacterium]